jgi:site-specific DNA-methyltransferase (adenine-specific)
VIDDRPWFQLSAGDAVRWLERIPSSSVDLVVTDPAYESLEKHRAIGTTTRLKEWFPIFRNERFPDLFREMHRILKPNTHCYVMCDQETAFEVAVPIGKRTGFTFWKAIIWDKVAMGTGYHYRAQHEFVLFFEKGARQLNDKGISDVLSIKRVLNGYPTEKPVELSRVLIEQSSERGQVVADPFMGSASSGQAALEVGRHYLGNDLLPKVLDPALERLSAAGGYPVLARPREELTLG